jgi:hypothetical protein
MAIGLTTRQRGQGEGIMTAPAFGHTARLLGFDMAPSVSQPETGSEGLLRAPSTSKKEQYSPRACDMEGAAPAGSDPGPGSGSGSGSGPVPVPVPVTFGHDPEGAPDPNRQIEGGTPDSGPAHITRGGDSRDCKAPEVDVEKIPVGPKNSERG